MHSSGSKNDPAFFQEEVNFRMNPPCACPSPFPQKSISYNNEKPHTERKCQAAQVILKVTPGKKISWRTEKTLRHFQMINIEVNDQRTGYLPSEPKISLD